MPKSSTSFAKPSIEAISVISIRLNAFANFSASSGSSPSVISVKVSAKAFSASNPDAAKT